MARITSNFARVLENSVRSIRERIPMWKRKVAAPPPEVPAGTVKALADPSRRNDIKRQLIKNASTFTSGDISRLIGDALTVSTFRRGFYLECESALEHPFVAGAIDLYLDAVCGYSKIADASVWITSKDPQIENILNQFLTDIHIEERLRDWAGTTATDGDFFIEAIGKEGMGIMFLDDSIHPADVERVDINGRLEGFVRTAFIAQTGVTSQLEAPWKFVHFRIFGVQRKMVNSTIGIFGEPGKRYQLEINKGDDQRYRITTRYGVSLIAPAVPVYKRLKLSEDSVLLARISRGILHILWKVKLTGGSFDAAADLLDEYARLLKRTSAMDITEGDAQWKDKFAPIYAQVEDLYVPETDDMTVTHEEVGGLPDIKGIVDVDMLEDRLLAALRTSRMQLGIGDQAGGLQIGQGSANRMSINFAKNAQRLQNGLRQGISRMCQIHLAFLGKPCGPELFDVHLAEISSAEEEELKDALKSGVDAAEKLTDLIVKVAGENNVERMDLLDYIVTKILKLDDFDIANIVKKSIQMDTSKFEESAKKITERYQAKQKAMQKRHMISTDAFEFLPTHVAGSNQKYFIDESKKIDREVKLWLPKKVLSVADPKEDKKA